LTLSIGSAIPLCSPFLLERLFSKNLIFKGNVERRTRFGLRRVDLEEDKMKLRFALAALVAAAVAVPTIASAETTIIKKYGDRDHFRGSRAEMIFRHDRGLHRAWYHRHGDRTVIIKKLVGRDD